jgi:hypothetical protein
VTQGLGLLERGLQDLNIYDEDLETERNFWMLSTVRRDRRSPEAFLSFPKLQTGCQKSLPKEAEQQRTLDSLEES